MWPAHAENEQRKEHLCVLQREYEDIDAKIGRLDEDFAVVRHRYELARAELCAHDHRSCFKDAHRRQLSPFSLPENTHYTSPWTIGSVSRRFRALAWALPRLWRCIHFEDAVFAPLGLAHYLRRSQSLPLCVLLDFDVFGGSVSSDIDTKLEAICDGWYLLRATMHRWEYLSITSDSEDVSQINEARFDLPVLKGLHVRQPNSSFFHSNTIRIPQLSFLCTEGIRFYPLTWSLTNVTLLRVGPEDSDRSSKMIITREEWIQILKAVPNVEKLSTHGLWIRSSLDQPCPAIVLPRLQLMEVGSICADWGHIPRISAPSLRTLHLHAIAPSDEPLMVNMLDEPLPPIQEMSHARLRECDLNNAEYRLVMSKVTSVVLHDGFDAAVDAVLGELCPRLEYLTIGAYVLQSPADPIQHLKKLVQARLDAGYPLKRLQINKIWCDRYMDIGEFEPINGRDIFEFCEIESDPFYSSQISYPLKV